MQRHRFSLIKSSLDAKEKDNYLKECWSDTYFLLSKVTINDFAN